MENLIYSIIISLVVYIIYYVIIIRKPKRLEKFIKNSRETNIIKTRFNLNYDLLDHKMIANYFAISNSFMIGLIFFIVMFVKNYVLKLLIAFISFTTLIVIIYLNIGKILKRKEEEKCTNIKK
ncbi:MAG: hypothetical protein RR659_03250 [Bacilli bacterium]